MRPTTIVKLTGVVLSLLTVVFDASAQNAPALFRVGTHSDSLVRTYDATLPLFNSALANMKVIFPQPYGAAVRVYYDSQDLEIQNLKLGLNDGGLQSIDGLLAFDSYTESAQTVSFHADAWVLPFLNVYGMAGITSIETEIGMSLPSVSLPSDFTFDIETSGSFVGYGATLAAVVGPVYISGDAQSVHSFSSNQDYGNTSITSGIRVGPVFNFKNKPKRNLIVWVGGLYTNYVNTSSGSYDVIDLIPQAQQDISRAQSNLNTWYQDLSASDQAKYEDQYQIVNGFLDDVSNNVDDASIQYQLDKRLDMPWDMIIGAEYQFSPKFLIKGEGQFLGSRTAFLFSMNYRFGNN